MIDEKLLKNIIVTIINDPDITEESITCDTQLIGEDGLFFDSIDVLELIVQIEKNFGIKITDNDLIQEKFKTFGTILDFINENAK